MLGSDKYQFCLFCQFRAPACPTSRTSHPPIPHPPTLSLLPTVLSFLEVTFPLRIHKRGRLKVCLITLLLVCPSQKVYKSINAFSFHFRYNCMCTTFLSYSVLCGPHKCIIKSRFLKELILSIHPTTSNCPYFFEQVIYSHGSKSKTQVGELKEKSPSQAFSKPANFQDIK